VPVGQFTARAGALLLLRANALTSTAPFPSSKHDLHRARASTLLLKTLAPTQQGPNCFPPEMDAFLDLVTGMSDNLEFA